MKMARTSQSRMIASNVDIFLTRSFFGVAFTFGNKGHDWCTKMTIYRLLGYTHLPRVCYREFDTFPWLGRIPDAH